MDLEIKKLIDNGQFEEAAKVLSQNGYHKEASKYYAMIWKWDKACEEAEKANELVLALEYALEGNLRDKEISLRETILKTQKGKLLEVANLYEKKGLIEIASHIYLLAGKGDYGATLLEKNYLLYEAALIREKLNQWSEAGKLYEKIIRLEPENFKAKFKLTLILIRFQKFQSALKLLQELLDKDPQNVDIIRWLVYVTYKLGLKDASTQYLRDFLMLSHYPIDFSFDVKKIVELCESEINDNALDLINSRYKIVKQIGSSTHGRIYLVDDLLLGSQIALKILFEDIKNKQHLLSALNFFKKVDYIGLTKVFEILPEDNLYTMELCDTSLFDKVIKREKVPLRGSFIGILKAIGFLHQKNIIHGNIKPTNVLFKENISKLSDPMVSLISSKGKTVTSDNIAHEIFYQAPEQIQGGKSVISTDYYCIGTTLYFVLTGIPPFISRTSLEQKIPKSDKIPSSLHNIIERLTEPDFTKRICDFNKLMEVFENLPEIIDYSSITISERFKENSKFMSLTDRFTRKFIIQVKEEFTVTTLFDNMLNRNLIEVRFQNRDKFNSVLEKAKLWNNIPSNILQSVLDIDTTNMILYLEESQGDSLEQDNSPLPLHLTFKLCSIFLKHKELLSIYNYNRLRKHIIWNRSFDTLFLCFPYDDELKGFPYSINFEKLWQLVRNTPIKDDIELNNLLKLSTIDFEELILKKDSYITDLMMLYRLEPKFLIEEEKGKIIEQIISHITKMD